MGKWGTLQIRIRFVRQRGKEAYNATTLETNKKLTGWVKSIVLNRIKHTLLKCKNSFIIIHDGLLTDSAETAKQHSELGIFQLNCRNSFRTLRVGQAFLFVNMKTYLRSHPSRLKDVMVILSLRSVVARKTMLCNTRLLPEKYKDIKYIYPN